MDSDETPEIEVEIPPEKQMPADVNPYSPDASYPMEVSQMSSDMGPKTRMFFEDAQVTDKGFGTRLRLRLTVAQMRRWTALFSEYIQNRNDALDAKFGEAWAMYAVTVETYPPGSTPPADDLDPESEDIIATCWTEKAAQGLRAAILDGEHPDYDLLDHDYEFTARVTTIPLWSEGQDPPWTDN